MSPHADNTAAAVPTATASNGEAVPVNDGIAPQEPGISRVAAEGKQAQFPRYASNRTSS